MTSSVVSILIPEEDWDCGAIYSNGRVLGHEIKVGSTVDLQLFLEQRHVLKHWAVTNLPGKNPDARDTWDSLLTLGIDDEPVRRILQPLRSKSNLAYFEGVVRKVVRRNSRLDPNVQHVHSLLECGLPIVLESQITPINPHALGEYEGEQIIGICKLWGWLYTPNTLLSIPLRAKITEIRPLETHPRSVMLTIEPGSPNTSAENKLTYTLLANES